MSWSPKFTIRSADNSTLLYTLTAAQSTNLPQSARETVQHTSQRSRGAVVIDGGIKPFDGIVEFVLWSNTGEYEDVASLIDGLESVVTINTPFILRIDRSSTTYIEYKIKRLVPFAYTDVAEDKILYRQKVTATFLCDGW